MIEINTKQTQKRLLFLLSFCIFFTISSSAAPLGDMDEDGHVTLKDLSVLNKCLSYLELRLKENGSLREEVSRREASLIVGIKSFGRDCVSRRHLDINGDQKNNKEDYWLLKSCLDYKTLKEKGYDKEQLKSLIKIDFQKQCTPVFE